MKDIVLGVIPARLGSTRLKRKMLADIGGKPLVWHTWKQALKAKSVDHVVIATDSKEIRDALLPYGADVIMTPKNIKTGSDRVAEAVKRFKKFKPTMVLNIQGDEPLVPPRAIDMVVTLLRKNKLNVMSTVAAPIKEAHELNDPNIVKVALKGDGNALYFSRSCIPFKREKTATPIYKHFGLYGYRTNFLSAYAQLKRTPLELTENLEQLRALENGYDIVVGIGNFEHVEVNTQEELESARRLIRQNKK
ncbi:3-deoxy-manno-octulosonate cytidylyltransferase [Patescibacteria group bacterium]|nr:3-deoxy-manno-octulosonate cytidylyltransferase [Patescibacteria group bacterium]